MLLIISIISDFFVLWIIMIFLLAQDWGLDDRNTVQFLEGSPFASHLLFPFNIDTITLLCLYVGGLNINVVYMCTSSADEKTGLN